jgi:3-hydroxybutyryl-CoA dehydrogenase
MDAPGTIGVAGAGTMGVGIAQLAALCGAQTLLYDPDRAALERALAEIERRLEREVARERLTQTAAHKARRRLRAASTLGELAPSELVIEAAPESLSLKHALLVELSERVVRSECVLATNTSSLLVTEIAAPVQVPERVVGMHFFNPPPLMAALELIAGVASADWALALARAAGEAMGKVVIEAVDGPGFLVNRCNRPFALEALALLDERAAEIEQIDRICRLGGGFRMGPFELMDLVGVDVNLDVARSMYEQSFGEPRWRPSPIAVRTVAAGRLGRKVGRGYYEYPDGEPERAGRRGGGLEYRAADPAPAARGGGAGRPVAILGSGQLALDLGELSAEAGWNVRRDPQADAQPPPFLVLDARTRAEAAHVPLATTAPRAVWCARGSLTAIVEFDDMAAGFMLLPPVREAKLVELTRAPATASAAIDTFEEFFRTLGLLPEWVGDAPGLVLGRIVSQLVNEAAFTLGAGIGSAADIDAGMVHALNYPRGILLWADQIGLDVVLGVLEALHNERRDPRYRPAPELSRRVWSGRLGRRTGSGFFSWPAR